MAATMAAAAEHEATADADYTEHLDSAWEAGGGIVPRRPRQRLPPWG